MNRGDTTDFMDGRGQPMSCPRSSIRSVVSFYGSDTIHLFGPSCFTCPRVVVDWALKNILRYCSAKHFCLPVPKADRPFRYWCISLPELSAEEYLATKNPVAYGLVPLMNYGQLSKPRLKAICLNGIATSDINEVQAAILAYFVDIYLPLTESRRRR